MVVSPRLAEKVAAVDGLKCKLYDTFRPKLVPDDDPDGEAVYRIGAMLPMKKDSDAPAEVVDMSEWKVLDEAVREWLNLERDPEKMAIELDLWVHRLDVPNPMYLKITNPSSLYLMKKELLKLPIADILSIDDISLYVREKRIFSLQKSKPPKRSGKHAMIEKKTRDLSVILYGEGTSGKHHLEGKWTEEADRYMAKNERHLNEYIRIKSCVQKALGKKKYLVHPKRCLCPFISTGIRSKCKEKMAGTVELSKINDLGQFIKHLREQHGSNPMAVRAAKRLKLAAHNRRMTEPQLDAEAGPMDWDMAPNEFDPSEEEYEMLREVLPRPDAFDPDFEVGSYECVQWINKNTAPPAEHA